MKLLQLYEGLFQYVCRLNRAAKTEAQPDYVRVRSEVNSLLADIQRGAANDVRLANQVKRLELPVIFFVDNLICTSPLKFATQWAQNRLANERNELAGDERFFDFLQTDLADPGEEAKERLAVFYTCLCLGFNGMYQAQPDQIRRYVEQIFPRISEWLDRDPSTKISEDAYRYTDTRFLTEPPSNKIVLVIILFAFFSLSVMTVYYGLYIKAASDLTKSVEKITSQPDPVR